MNNLKKIILIGLTFLIYGVTYAQTTNKMLYELPEPGKFRNIDWGTPLDSFYIDGKKIELKKHERNTLTESFEYDFWENVYTIPNDDMTIGAAEMERIYYVFDEKDRLYRIAMYGSGENYFDIGFILRSKFGNPNEVTYLDGEKSKTWTVGDVDFVLTNIHLNKHFELTIFSNWRDDVELLKNLQSSDF